MGHYSSLVVFNLNSFKISTIINGANDNSITSSICTIDNVAILKIPCKPGISSTISIRAADKPTAPNNVLFVNNPTFAIESLFERRLNTCTNSANASTVNAIVCACNALSGFVASDAKSQPAPKPNANSVNAPTMIPW